MKINSVDVRIFSDKSKLYKAVAKEYISLLKDNNKVTLGLATGSTPIPLYEILSKEYKNGNISFENVKTFNLDEYIGLSSEHPQSYAKFMNNHLFSKVNINPKNINLLDGNTTNIEKELKRYDKLLKKETVDIQILGIGSDGHIAFNEPGVDPNLNTHVIDLDERTIKDNARFFNNSLEEVPKKAITMSIKDILKAKRIILIATGKNKSVPISQLIYGEINNILPASFLKKHSNVTLYLDEEAASLLKK